MIDPNGKHRIVQFLEQNIGESPDDAGYGDDFRYPAKDTIHEINNCLAEFD